MAAVSAVTLVADPRLNPAPSDLHTRSARVAASRAPVLVLLVSASVSVGLWLYGSVRQLGLSAAEWDLVLQRTDWSAERLLAPVDSTWSTVPVLAYRLLIQSGLTSYDPFAAILVLSHLLAAAAVYFTVTRSAGRRAGLAAAAVLLSVGWAHDVLLRPLAVGAPVAVAAGAVGLLLWDSARPRIWRDAVAAAALLVAVASSLIGVAFGLAAIGLMLLAGAARPRLLWPVSALAAYLGWRLVYGGEDGAATAAQTLMDPAALEGSLTHLSGALLGVGPDWGVPAAMVVASGFALLLRGGRKSGRAATFLAALVVLHVLEAALRQSEPRPNGGVMYGSVALALLAVGELAPHRSREAWPATGRLVTCALVAWLLIFGLSGVLAYERAHTAARARTVQSEAVLATVELFPELARVQGDIVMDTILFGEMTFADYQAVARSLGTPVADWSPATILGLPDDARLAADRLLFRMSRAYLEPEPSPRPTRGIRRARFITNAEVMLLRRMANGCSVFRVGGRDPLVMTSISDGERLFIRADESGRAHMFASAFAATHQDGASTPIVLEAARWYTLAAPTLPDELEWTIRVDPPPGATELELCVAASASARALDVWDGYQRLRTMASAMGPALRASRASAEVRWLTWR